MSEEAVDTGLAPAPEAEVTATPAEAVSEVSPVETKTFTQEDVDKIVAKEKARVERKLQREADRRVAEATRVAQPAEKPSEPAKPTPDQFKTTEEYVEAVAEWKAEQKVSQKLNEYDQKNRQRQQSQAQQETLQAFAERQEQAREKYEDFDEVAFNPSLKISDAMAATIQQSDLGCDIAYHLGKNPKEAERIAKLSPFLQAKELGKLEAKLASEPPPKKPSAAPAPITPVKPQGTNGMVIDTTDSKSSEKLLSQPGGTSAWIEAERQRQRREWEAKHR